VQDALFFLAHFFPWWATPLALVFGEVANHYRRVGKRRQMMGYGLLSALLVVAIIGYIFFDGYHNLIPALRGAGKELGQ
jgi:hypothetical protein